MFERFTAKARRVLVAGQEEARGLGHSFIGTEHLLLGMLRVEDSIGSEIMLEAGLSLDQVRAHTVSAVGRGAGVPRGESQPDAEALRAIGIDLEQVRDAIEKTFGTGALEGTETSVRRLFGRRRRRSGMPAFTPAAKALLERALREALQLGHNYIGTEHLLLASSRPQAGLCSRLLAEAGLTHDVVRAQVVQKLDSRRST